MRQAWRASLVSLVGLLSLGLWSGVVGAEETVWQQLVAGGKVVLMRHTTTVPGFGDPPGFRLEDCATQRNLSEAGRDEARRIGERLRQHRVPIGDIRSSRWCRCQETARLVFGRDAESWPLLDSVHEKPDRRETQTEMLRQSLVTTPVRANLFLVTHQANILALTGKPLAQGEMIVLAPREGRLDFIGRIAPVP